VVTIIFIRDSCGRSIAYPILASREGYYLVYPLSREPILQKNGFDSRIITELQLNNWILSQKSPVTTIDHIM
jgi:hypothetical protein